MGDPDKLRADFERFHADNPRVYRYFCKFALEAARVRERYSADAVLHRVRWFTSIETINDDGFKISNNHCAFYARLFMRDYPQYEGFFATHRSAADGSMPPPVPPPTVADARAELDKARANIDAAQLVLFPSS